MNYASFWCAVLLLFAQTAISQSTQDALPTRITDTIPFTLTPHNNISLQAVLNGRDTLNLMLHTAADGITLIESVADSLPSMQLNGQDSVSSWGGAQESRYGSGNTLNIGKQEWTEQTIWINTNSGPLTDGKIGLGMFAGRVVELNFDASILLIHSDVPHLDSNYTALKIAEQGSLIFTYGYCQIGDSLFENRFLIHSGYSGSVLLDDVFVKEHQLGERLPILEESTLSDSYGNILKTKKAQMQGFYLKQEGWTDVPVGFFEGEIARQKMSVIGGAIFKRFNWVFDLEHHQVYIQPNALYDSPFGTI
jgi:hypothetical protein